jgi:class 3 adenylate cyclase
MGLHTGELEERYGGSFGSAVNLDARLMALAHGGQVVASAATADVVADPLRPKVKLVDLGEHLLRDLSRGEHVFQVEARDSSRTSRCCVRPMSCRGICR